MAEQGWGMTGWLKKLSVCLSAAGMKAATLTAVIYHTPFLLVSKLWPIFL